MDHVLTKPGFTIIEVLISIAIALLLILGVNQVFSIAQQTSGAGTTALAQVENARGAAQIMQRDYNAAVTGPDCPAIVIISEPIYAFRNRQDMLNSQNPNNPELLDNPVPGNQPILQPLTAINSRVHRIDRIMFFTRDIARRDTPSGLPPLATDLVSNTAWLESYIWYGHLALPSNANPNDPTFRGPRPGYPTPFVRTPGPRGSDFWNPGDRGTNGLPPLSNNPNNFFASDWILGRMPVLLVPFPTSVGINGFAPYEVTMAAANAQSTPLSILGTFGSSPAQASQVSYGTGGALVLSPPPGAASTIPLYSSLCDQALTSVDGYRQLSAADPLWWERLSGWSFNPLGLPPLDVRFQANPIPQRPSGMPPAQIPQWMSVTSARQAPIFLRGCSQFIVEYAGDFLRQDNNPQSMTFGQVTGPDPDGEVDYIVENVGGQQIKRIRWYGFPRDVSGPQGVPDGRIDWRVDVAPIRDVIMNSPNYAGPRQAAAFEPTLLPNGQQTLPMAANYAAPNAVRPGSQYVCAWGPSLPNTPKPKMIRITFALDDPAGRLNNEQYFEYVFNLP